MTTLTAFEQLHNNIQHALWDMEWTELRPIQVQAIHFFKNQNCDLVISANTASGKTEAAFLPILSAIADDFKGSVKALYIGPLKALINDQFRRLEELCARAEIPVHRWHGDVSSTDKKTLTQKPSGVLLITPESIESLFINRSPYLQKIFSDLQYVVIDEIHAFMGTERGAHLLSLLYRLQTFSSTLPRRLGLSATIGDMQAACSWLQSQGQGKVGLIQGEGDRDLAVIIKGYLIKPFKAGSKENARNTSGFDVAADIYKAFKGRSNLIFGNSKSRLEFFTDLLQQISRHNGCPNEFLIHHGSLVKSIREEAEHLMRSGNPFTTFCTNTLELGIDIGYVDTIGQIDPPFSVNSLIQRIGRSGRKEGASAKLRFFIQEFELDKRNPPWEMLYQKLLQAIAMVELLIEGWCETPQCDRPHYSTFVQQVLSVLTQTGGMQADKLYDTLVVNGFFKDISVEDFTLLLRRLAEHKLIDQMAEGDLILGLTGEKIVSHCDFYAAFKSPDEYHVINQSSGKAIGTLPMEYPIPIGEHLILAGKRWQVTQRDDSKKIIFVLKARSSKPPFFTSGHQEISYRIRKKMLEVLFYNDTPLYLDKIAEGMFHQMQQYAQQLQLDKQRFYQFGPSTVVFTWTGSRTNTTLRLAAVIMGCKVSDFGIGLVFEEQQINDVKSLFQKIYDQGVDAHAISQYTEKEFKTLEKYDEYLPDELLNLSYINNRLNVPGAKALTAELLNLIWLTAVKKKCPAIPFLSSKG